MKTRVYRCDDTFRDKSSENNMELSKEPESVSMSDTDGTAKARREDSESTTGEIDTELFHSIDDSTIKKPDGLKFTPPQSDAHLLKTSKNSNSSAQCDPVSSAISTLTNQIQESQENEPTKTVKIEKKSSRVGNEYLVNIPAMLTTNPIEYHSNAELQEELTWRSNVIENVKDEEIFVQETRNVYWRAVWRQFHGQVQFETVLQHLMENEYSFAKSLENIENILSSLPPTTKILSKWQALRLFQQAMDEYVTHEKLRKLVMPNFNITDIHLFRFQFIRFYMFNAACICHHSLCNPVEFEPRHGCTNYAKLLKESSDIEKLCLLCQTYQMITGTTRPSNHVNFTNEERKLISACKANEKELNKFMDREVFEKLCNDEKIQRWKDLKLTDEENIMLGFENSRTRTSYTKKTDAQKRTYLLENLQPFVLPIFIDCNCFNSAERKALMKKQQLCLPKVYGPRVVRFAEDFNPWLDLSTE